jgi:hypothetical protein
MDTKAIVESYFTCIEPALAFIALVALFRSKQIRTILPLSLLLGLVIFGDVAYLVLHAIGVQERLHHQPMLAYNIYFYIHWICYTLGAGVTFFLLRRLFQMAMDPLAGLQRLGMIVFRWVAVASVLIAVFSSVTPNVSAVKFLISAATQLQRTQSIMVLCLLFFLTFTAKPLAFTYKSRIFGVGIGLGMMACTDLVESAWIAQTPSMYSTYNLVKGGVALTAMLIWIGYYVMAEANRGLVTLPVTSPLLRWNEIGVALGYPETHVVVTSDGIPMFGEAEVEAMRLSQGRQAQGRQLTGTGQLAAASRVA